jgi:ribosomal protein S8
MTKKETILHVLKVIDNYIIHNFNTKRTQCNGICCLLKRLNKKGYINDYEMLTTHRYISTHRPSPRRDREFYDPMKERSPYYFPINDWDTRLAWVRKQIKNLQK